MHGICKAVTFRRKEKSPESIYLHVSNTEKLRLCIVTTESFIMQNTGTCSGTVRTTRTTCIEGVQIRRIQVLRSAHHLKRNPTT